jgi:hypothetical protein
LLVAIADERETAAMEGIPLGIGRRSLILALGIKGSDALAPGSSRVAQ